MRVMVLVNVLNMISAEVYSNHIGFWCHTKTKHPDIDFKFFTPPRMSVDMARNTAAKMALQCEADYLLFIDDDVLIPPDTFSMLKDVNADIAAGLVIIRGYPFNVMAFKKVEGNLPYFNDLPVVEVEIEPEIKIDANGFGRPAIIKKVLKDPVTQEDGLIAVGFSCCLIKTSLLRKVPPPYFITGPRNTEDIYFCLKARDVIKLLQENDKSVPDLTLSMVTSLRPGHLLNAEPIEWATIDVFKEFYESLDPDKAEAIRDNQNARDINYIRRNLQAL